MAALGLTDALTQAVRASAEMQTELADLKRQLHEANVKAVEATTTADQRSRTVDELLRRVHAEMKISGAAIQERDTIGAELRKCEGRCADERRARLTAQEGQRKAERGKREVEAALTANEERRILAHNARISAEQELCAFRKQLEDKERVLRAEKDEVCQTREALRIEKEELCGERKSLTALLERSLHGLKAGHKRQPSPDLPNINASSHEPPHKRAKREDVVSKTFN
ncbi:hypothetical protein B0H16DRAFT_1526390 [Mycena metata]|uniref:Uncharacterized protein n=1 Tax=Mycena metata TaxID=1033252 RepID=A0AAD7NKE8_9AGAR|nr:hypothetical protein B0H16DRAFT_1526390 [Mycena metata]